MPERGQYMDAWDRFTSGIHAKATENLYGHRMNAFLTYIYEGKTLRPAQGHKLPKVDEEKRRALAKKFVKETTDQAEEHISLYIYHLKERVKAKEIQESTIAPSVNPIRKFCRMNRMKGIDWDYIYETVPPSKKDANDTTPELSHIMKLLNMCSLRLKVMVLLLLSTGMRLGAFNSLHVGDITEVDVGEFKVGRVVVYRGDREQYVTFCSPEALASFREYVEFRRRHGEDVGPQSPAIRDAFDSSGARGAAGKVKWANPYSLERLLLRLWYKSGAFTQKAVNHRHPWKTAHSLRKYYKTAMENQAEVKSLHVMMLMEHSAGVSGDSYYRPSEKELIADYLKGVPYLTVSEELRQKEQLRLTEEKAKEVVKEAQFELVRERDERRAWEERFKALEDRDRARARQIDELLRKRPTKKSV